MMRGSLRDTGIRRQQSSQTVGERRTLKINFPSSTVQLRHAATLRSPGNRGPSAL